MLARTAESLFWLARYLERADYVARLLQEFPPRTEQTEQGELLRGLGIRLSVTRTGDCGGATAELQLGDAMRFFPTDAALAHWRAQADQGEAVIVYE